MLSAVAACMMDEEFANETGVDNLTSTTQTPDEDDVSLDQLHACAVYMLATFGIVQLIITIIGLVGKLH